MLVSPNFVIDWQARDLGEWMVEMKSEDRLLEYSLFLGKASLSAPLRSSIDWMRPAQNIEAIYLIQSSPI